MSRRFWVWSLLTVMSFGGGRQVEAQPDFVYGRQYGTSAEDVLHVPVCDASGNVYVAGWTMGSLEGAQQGEGDALIQKFDAAGKLVWTRQLGVPAEDRLHWMTSDAEGNLIAVGHTKGDFAGSNAGGSDLIVIKMGSDGKLIWKKQFGSEQEDMGRGVCVDAQGAIYVVGGTSGKLGETELKRRDAFLMKLSAGGEKLFVSQFGSNRRDVAQAVTVDEQGRIYLCGTSNGRFGSELYGQQDAFFARLDQTGLVLKVIRFGSDQPDTAQQIVVDRDGNIYVGCSSAGELGGEQQGEGDALLVKFDPAGSRIWARQFGTPGWDGILGLSLNEKVSEHLFVSGCQNYPQCKSFCRVYSKEGELLWSGNYSAQGKTGGTCGKASCVADDGSAYHVGITGGALFADEQGEHDAFLLKLDLLPSF